MLATLCLIMIPAVSGFMHRRDDDGLCREHGWDIVWHDEFDVDDLSRAWDYDLYDSWQYGFGQWGNDEKQFYTKDNECFERCINAGKVRGTPDFDGCMDGCGNTGNRCANIRRTGISSGRLYVKERGFQPSLIHPLIRIEARIRMSSAGRGLWPAFWLLPWHDAVGSVAPGEGRYGAWPASGEIDIFETANDMSFVHGSLHDGTRVITHATALHPPATSYHVYGIEWHRMGMIRWYVDGQYYSGTDQSNARWWTNARGAPFDQPFYPILNLAVGGTYPSSMAPASIDELQTMLLDTGNTVSMDIDYIRVCAKTRDTNPGQSHQTCPAVGQDDHRRMSMLHSISQILK